MIVPQIRFRSEILQPKQIKVVSLLEDPSVEKSKTYSDNKIRFMLFFRSTQPRIQNMSDQFCTISATVHLPVNQVLSFRSPVVSQELVLSSLSDQSPTGCYGTLLINLKNFFGTTARGVAIWPMHSSGCYWKPTSMKIFLSP